MAGRGGAAVATLARLPTLRACGGGEWKPGTERPSPPAAVATEEADDLFSDEAWDEAWAGAAGAVAPSSSTGAGATRVMSAAADPPAAASLASKDASSGGAPAPALPPSA
jgi:hypothetical protein